MVFWPMFSWTAMKQCPGEGCQNRIWSAQEMCATCLKANNDVGVHLWALQGFKDFRIYLASWAAFEERHGPN